MIDLRLGNSLDVLRTMPDNSIDAVVCDPPYGISFMLRTWDYDIPSVDIWRECLRVLKPGGHLLAFAGTRTQHRMACAIEDAGFEIRDMIAWVYGCLSEDSEVLTEDGWMRYNNAKQKNILTYDLQNDVYQWEKPSRWNEYCVESDTAYRIQSDHTDQIVSRDHRCIVERGGVLEFVQADELTGVERVPYLQGDFSALPQGRGELLLQAMLREGEGLAQETFSQRQGKEVPIEGASRGEKPGVEGRRDPLQAQGQVCGSGDQVRSLPGCVHEHGAEGRLRNGAPTSCCDGNRSSSDAQGVCASHQPRRDGQSHGEPDAICEQCGSQTVRARASYQTTLATVTAVEYSGLIWCPTVSTGAFVARRNGKVFITGNSGFPKNMDVSKAIDKAAGVDREVLGVDPVRFARLKNQVNGSTSTGEQWAHGGRDVTITAPATEQAKQWEGWGTALKPALEPVTVARKPITGTVAANVLEHGTGAINIDGCRVGERDRTDYGLANSKRSQGTCYGQPSESADFDSTKGRFPANLIHDGSDEVIGLFPESNGSGGSVPNVKISGYGDGVVGTGKSDYIGGERKKVNCGTGSAARFFYCAKANKKDRGEGNSHPTVKPTDLMRYLCRLVTPPGGIVLDPFMGSGSTGKAAVAEGFRFVGIEMIEEYFAIAYERITGEPYLDELI